MRKPTSEEIADLFDTNPEFFAAVLGRETVIGCTVIMPGHEPVYMEKREVKQNAE
jgi:hypothetical protein